MDGNPLDAFILEEDPSIGSSIEAYASQPQSIEVPAGSGTLPVRADRPAVPKADGQSRISRKSGRPLWSSFPFKHAIPPRAAHSCDSLPNGLVVVFGGWNGSDALNDLHVLEVSTATWYQVEAVCPPTRRNNHASAVVGNSLYIHGGHDGNRWLQDFYYIDLTVLVNRGPSSLKDVLNDNAGQLTWVQPTCSGKAPRPRACHTLTRLRRKLYMFGGYDGSHCFNEVDILNLDSMTWTPASVSGTLPEGRNAHSMTVYNTSLYLCGGHAGKHHMTDLFVFETQTRIWKEVPATGTWPPGLRGHSATLVGDHLMLIGGYDGKYRNDDIYILDIPMLRWTRLVEDGDPYCSRQRHSTTLIAPKKLFIFGGFNGSTWMSDGLVLDAAAITNTSVDENVGDAHSASPRHSSGYQNGPKHANAARTS